MNSRSLDLSYIYNSEIEIIKNEQNLKSWWYKMKYSKILLNIIIIALNQFECREWFYLFLQKENYWIRSDLSSQIGLGLVMLTFGEIKELFLLFRTHFELDFQLDFEPISNRFRTDFELISNWFRTWFWNRKKELFQFVWK